MEIPVIDWQSFLSTNDARIVVENFSKLGFLLLKNHGIPLAHVQEAFRISQKFFHLPPAAKKSVVRGTFRDSNSGYVEYQMESLNTASADKKEALNITCEPWLLPESLSFLSQLDSFYKEAWQLGMHILEQFDRYFNWNEDKIELRKYHTFESLGFNGGKKEEEEEEEEEECAAFFKNRASTLRLLYYPPVAETNSRIDEVLAGVHSDYGTLTLLFQDSCGGLQVQQGQDWISVPAQEDIIVVNAGDLLEIWTGGSIPSTKHRVVVQPEMAKSTKGRHSIAVFIHPDDDTVVQPLYGNTIKYNPVLASEYLTSRFRASYKEM